MGYELAGRVRINWRHLPGNAFKTLNEMAWCAHDSDDPPRYWAGPGRLAWALGRLGHEDDPPSDADLRAVSEALTFLRRAGAIDQLRKPGPGVRAEYALRLPLATCEENPRASTGEENPRVSRPGPSPHEAAAGATHEDFPRQHTRVFRSNTRGFPGSTHEENPRTKEQEKRKRETTRETRSSQVGVSPGPASAEMHPGPPDDPEAEPRRFAYP